MVPLLRFQFMAERRCGVAESASVATLATGFYLYFANFVPALGTAPSAAGGAASALGVRAYLVELASRGTELL